MGPDICEIGVQSVVLAAELAGVAQVPGGAEALATRCGRSGREAVERGAVDEREVRREGDDGRRIDDAPFDEIDDRVDRPLGRDEPEDEIGRHALAEHPDDEVADPELALGRRPEAHDVEPRRRRRVRDELRDPEVRTGREPEGAVEHRADLAELVRTLFEQRERELDRVLRAPEAEQQAQVGGVRRTVDPLATRGFDEARVVARESGLDRAEEDLEPTPATDERPRRVRMHREREDRELRARPLLRAGDRLRVPTADQVEQDVRLDPLDRRAERISLRRTHRGGGIARPRGTTWYLSDVALLFPRLEFPDDRVAVDVDDVRHDYVTLASLAAGHADDLAARGIGPGDRVGLVTHGTATTVAALVGQAMLGVVTVPMNPKSAPAELAHIVADSEPRAIYSDPDAPASSADESPLATTLSGRRSDRRLHRPIDDAPVLVLYTSGTTGAPKGAILSARNIASNLDGLAAAWNWTDADTVVHALPLFHVHGLVLGLFGSLRVGGALAHRSRFDPHSLAAALDESSVLFAVPTMYHRLIEASETDPSIGRSLARARLLISGSAALPVRDHLRLEALTGRGVHERYGSTETLIDCAIPASARPRPGYVGPPVPGVELRLVDDERRTLEAHDDVTIGEIAARSASLFRGYLNRADATNAVMDADGWFYTGDLATRTDDGYYRIVGRRSTDLIKTGGYKVGAGEIEACFLEHPSVAECAVVGAADPDLGERIVAYVVLRVGPVVAEAELSAHVAAQLSPYKRPREIHLRESLPRNAMGKVVKAKL